MPNDLMELAALADRCEKASGPDDALDMDIAYWCYKNGAVAGINYDPAIWMIRHGWSPTASLDAAMTLVADHDTPSFTGCGPEGVPRGCVTCMTDDYAVDYVADAVTPALALTAAALRARARSAS